MVTKLANNATSYRQKYKDDLRRMILDAARNLFVREGYESFSMRKLARQIEYSPAGIYLHFKSKDELFLALVEESFARLLEAQRKLDERYQDGDPVELLKQGLQGYVEFGLENPNDYRFAFLLNRPGDAPLRNNKPAFDHPRQRVVRCVEQKRFGEIDIETASQALWCAAHGVTSLLIQEPKFPWVSRGKLINQVIDSAVDGFAARKAGASHAS